VQIVQSTTTFSVDPVANLRRSMIIGAVLGLASIAVLAPVGHALMGVFACVGLALGAVNNRMLQRSVIQYATADLAKGRFRGGVVARLAGITIVAIAIALLVRPDGAGIFAGLAVFQVLMLVGAALPVLRSLRGQSV
jgi:hypothetical protein